MTRDCQGKCVQRISVSAKGRQANFASGDPAWSPGGTKIAFTSSASNLVPKDTNRRTDVFVKDLQTGGVRRISVNARKRQSNTHSSSPAWSPDGTKIAFYTQGKTNLVRRGAPFAQPYHLLLKDLQSGAVRLIQADVEGGSAPVWSPDGAAIAFVSYARTGVIPDDPNKEGGVFVRDLQSGSVRRVSAAANGVQARGLDVDPVSPPAWSPDGTGIAFVAKSPELAPNAGGYYRIVVKDLQSGDLRVIIPDGQGGQADGHHSQFPTWSPDGTKIAFTFDSALYVMELTSGVVEEIYSFETDLHAGYGGIQPEWSPDGTEIAFMAFVGKERVPMTNFDLFVMNLDSGEVKRMYTPSAQFAWSPKSNRIAFTSYAADLVPKDTNRQSDVLVVSVP